MFMCYYDVAASPSHLSPHVAVSIWKANMALISRSLQIKGRGSLLFRALISTSSVCTGNGVLDGAGDSKLYELRTYAIKPDRMAEFMKIMQEGFSYRTAHSKLNGYWTTDLGGVNEVVHIWEYDNYAHRTSVRKAIAQDKDWLEKCFSKILPMFVSQTNVVMKAFPWCDMQLEPSQMDPGVYELVCHQIKPGLVSQFEHRLLQDYSQLDYHPLGIWYSVFGEVNRVYSLLRYDSLDQREAALTDADSHEVTRDTFRDLDKFLDGTIRKVLVPTTFSPLQ